MAIYPCEDINRWETCCTTQLANAEDYYTKYEVDKKIDDIVISGSVTSGQVQEMIDESTSATTEQVNELSATVSQMAEDILNRYTKEETNDLLSQYLSKLEANEKFAKYAKIEGTTLILNNENITI